MSVFKSRYFIDGLQMALILLLCTFTVFLVIWLADNEQEKYDKMTIEEKCARYLDRSVSDVSVECYKYFQLDVER